MPAKLSLTLEDSKKRTTKRVYGMDTQTLLADYLTAIGTFLTALTAVTDLGMVKADLIIPVTGLTWAYTAGANIDVGGTASGWLDTTEPKKASAKIPHIKDSLVSADGSIAISGATATYLAEFETDADFTLSDGEQIDSWIKASLDK